jgi:uncharacterized protein (TIGR03435 family)
VAVKDKNTFSEIFTRKCIIPSFLLLGLFAVDLPGQSPATRPAFEAFEVATIKPTAPEELNGGRFIRMQSAHRFEAKNVSVSGLISAAYDLNPEMISGGPAWLEKDRYDVVAAAPGESRPSYDDEMRMLRKLLNDRFNLKFHRAEKEFAIYEVTVARSGPKLRLTSAQPDEPSNVTSTLRPAASGGIDYVLLPARNITLVQFASVLQRAILDRPVVDHTGLTERYDFDIEWTPDGSQFGGQLPPGPPDSGKPGLFTALREQLGLKIEATRGPIETLVIDRVAKPSDN